MDEKLTKAEISFIGQLLTAISIKSFRKLLTDHILNAFIASHNNTNIEFDFGKSKPDPNTIDYIKEREIILSDKTASKLEGDLKYELITALQNNESIGQITKRLDKIFTDMMPWQLERIARSEVIDAQNAGRISAYKASDVVEYKMWIAAKGGKGERVCDLCASMHGQIRPVDKPFVNPNNPAESWQHPICHPNGRCTTVPLMDLPDNMITVNGLTYDSDEKLGKVEILVDSLNKGEKVIKVKATSKRKAHYRTIEEADDKPDVMESESIIKKILMTKDNIKSTKTAAGAELPMSVHIGNITLCEFKDGGKGIYKTSNNEMNIIGEIGSRNISETVGWNIVPQTERVDLGKGDGTCQAFIEGTHPALSSLYGELVIEEKHFDDLAKILAMDILVGNPDRHNQNVIIDDEGKVWAIDNDTWVQNENYDKSDVNETFDALKYYSGDRSVMPGVYHKMCDWIKKSLNDEDRFDKFKDVVDIKLSELMEHKDTITTYYNDVDKDNRINSNIKAIEEYLVRQNDNNS